MISDDLSGNPRRFVIFSVFYNARAYYPVLAILFLDLGLTLDQYVLLNLIWAATIFLFEVPSGALADVIGRRKLLVIATWLMVVEMLCLLFAPRGGGLLLFGWCIVNRVCSGLSEACASGADEALAYDSLPEANRADAWDQLFAKTMRWRSGGMVAAMILGGLIYQPGPLNRLLPAGFQISLDTAHRLPIALVLCQSIVCLVMALRMVEPPRPIAENSGLASALRSTIKLTLETALWVFRNPKTWVVVVVGLSIDSFVRNFATINSSYYRLIELPEWSYGFIGASISLLGWFVPSLARHLNARYGTLVCLEITAAAALLGMAALVPAWRGFGLLPVMFLLPLMGLLGFTISRALHRETDSSRRATVLSVKGLAFNLGYGVFSLGFARLLAGFPDQPAGSALRHALFWQVPSFAVLMLSLLTWARKTSRRVRA
jgi:MFS family permease